MLFGGRGYFSCIIQIKRLEKTSQVLYETFSRFQRKFSMKLSPSTSSNTSPQEKIGCLLLLFLTNVTSYVFLNETLEIILRNENEYMTVLKILYTLITSQLVVLERRFIYNVNCIFKILPRPTFPFSLICQTSNLSPSPSFLSYSYVSSSI